MRLNLFYSALFVSTAAIAGGTTPAAKPIVLVPNLNSLAQTQSQMVMAAAAGNRRASGLARGLGGLSIANGVKHIRHGRSHHSRSVLRMGYLEVLEGVLGIVAANVADKTSKKIQANADNLNAVPGAQNSASQEGGSNSGASQDADMTIRKTEIVSLSQDNPDFKEALTSLEEEHGLSKAQVIEALASGQDSRELMKNAPIDPWSDASAQQAYKKARELDGEALAAGTIATSPQPSPAAAQAAVVPAPKVIEENLYGNGRAQGKNLRSSLARRLASGEGNDSDSEMEVSAEIKAALAAREAEKAEREKREARASHEMNIFEVVHEKYVERENNLRWGNPLRTAER